MIVSWLLLLKYKAHTCCKRQGQMLLWTGAEKSEFMFIGSNLISRLPLTLTTLS